ncbi:unnamed protein product [Blepharisma stoltei]|uniref:poly(ADP-ribose) glycohydrolase n=1 Tax=Blepharisma stoltei TaxID=1481888 RepID=A0AAU9JZL0_9CILI|nr:unnamed protein product [Blepharisma stoltei]
MKYFILKIVNLSEMQRNIDEFFGLKGRAANPNQNRQQNSDPPNRYTNPRQNYHQNDANLRLPHHTAGLWRMVKPRLLLIATKQKNTVEDMLEYICDFIVETRLAYRNTINIELLVRIFSENEAEMLDLLAKIAEYALEVEFLFNQPVRILRKYQTVTIDLSQKQIRCLLALQFWCCLPKQENYLDLPKEYTFFKVFGATQDRNDSQIAKLKCLFNYFRRSKTASERVKLSFLRRCLEFTPDWNESRSQMSNLIIIEEQNSMEDYRDKLMIDFANAYIGGGILSTGCVQEEIMFAKHIEPIVAMLFTEKLEDKEALIIVGAQRYNETLGYKQSFEWIRNFNEDLSYDNNERIDSYIVCIDACNFAGNVYQQYFPKFVERELNKAFIGFMGDPGDMKWRDIVTGRWGCGAFYGNEQLKFLIQWVAASGAGRNMYFLPWEMKNVEQLLEFKELVQNMQVSEVAQAILKLGVNAEHGIFNEVLRILRLI